MATVRTSSGDTHLRGGLSKSFRSTGGEREGEKGLLKIVKEGIDEWVSCINFDRVWTNFVGQF